MFYSYVPLKLCVLVIPYSYVVVGSLFPVQMYVSIFIHIHVYRCIGVYVCMYVCDAVFLSVYSLLELKAY